jgi:hypothetical protein
MKIPSKMLGVAAAILLVGGAIIALSGSQHFSDPRLGTDWQCTRTAIFIAVCSPRGPLITRRNRTPPRWVSGDRLTAPEA